MKIGSLFIVALSSTVLIESSSACVAIGDICSKVGEACCSSSDSAKNTQCLGDNNTVFLRNYSCTECTTADPWECYDELSEFEWYFTMTAYAIQLMVGLIFFFGMSMELLKCVGVIPNPKRNRPEDPDHVHVGPAEEDQELLVIVLPEI